MRRILLSLLLFCGDVGPVLALSAEDLPGSFSIKEQKCNTDTCFDLTTNGQTIGSLRRTPGTLGTFDFFDQQHQRQVILKFTKTFWGSPQFEVYDKNQVLIGQLQLTFDRKIGRVIRFVPNKFEEPVMKSTFPLAELRSKRITRPILRSNVNCNFPIKTWFLS